MRGAGTAGNMALTGDAALTINVAPMPVNYRQTLVEDLTELWQWLTGQPWQKVVTGGIIGTHESNGGAVFVGGPTSVSGEAHHSLGQASAEYTVGLTAIGYGEYYTDSTLTISAPVQNWETPQELTYFNVSGNFYDLEAPALTGASTQTILNVISANVTFWPGYIDSNGITHCFPEGFGTYIENLDLGDGIGDDTFVALPPITARVLSGQLETIDQGNAVGIQLVSNSDVLNLPAEYSNMIYVVEFSDVVYAESGQVLNGFAFLASTDDTAITITDPGVAKLPYANPPGT